VSTPESSEYTTQPAPTNKASTTYGNTAFYSSIPHTISHSAKPELLSVTPTSSANSENATMFQTASESVYTLSASPTPTNPQSIAGTGIIITRMKAVLHIFYSTELVLLRISSL